MFSVGGGTVLREGVGEDIACNTSAGRLTDCSIGIGKRIVCYASVGGKVVLIIGNMSVGGPTDSICK